MIGDDLNAEIEMEYLEIIAEKCVAPRAERFSPSLELGCLLSVCGAHADGTFSLIYVALCVRVRDM